MKQPRLLALTLFLAIELVARVPAQADLAVPWITRYGTSNLDYGNAITVDAQSQVWVAGYTLASLGGPSNGGLDVFLSRLSSDGALDFTRQHGGGGYDVATAVATIGNGSVFVGDSSDVDNFPPPIDGQAPIGASGEDALTVRYDSTGAWQGTKLFGSVATDKINAMAGTATSLLTVGYTEGRSKGNPPSAMATLLSARGTIPARSFGPASSPPPNQRQAPARLSTGPAMPTSSAPRLSAASEERATKMSVRPALAGESATGLGVDDAGHIWIAGNTASDFAGHVSAGQDGFVAEYDSAGLLLGTTFLSTPGSDSINGLALGPDGAAYITGTTDGTGFGRRPARPIGLRCVLRADCCTG